jgi:hypothetical protein
MKLLLIDAELTMEIVGFLLHITIIYVIVFVRKTQMFLWGIQ